MDAIYGVSLGGFGNFRQDGSKARGKQEESNPFEALSRFRPWRLARVKELFGIWSATLLALCSSKSSWAGRSLLPATLINTSTLTLGRLKHITQQGYMLIMLFLLLSQLSSINRQCHHACWSALLPRTGWPKGNLFPHPIPAYPEETHQLPITRITLTSNILNIKIA